MSENANDFPKPEVTESHRWLQQLVGDWTFSGECQTPQGPQSQTGRLTVRPFGDLWVQMEGESDVASDIMRSIITLGFDPVKDKFVGSFIATVMTHFWVYEGARDADGKTLPLKCKGPRVDGAPGLADYEDVIEVTDKDNFSLRGRVQQDDGTWLEFMTTKYTRSSA
jgi:hypothetical protein